MDLYKDKVLKMQMKELVKVTRCFGKADCFTRKGYVKDNCWFNNRCVKDLVDSVRTLKGYCNQIIDRAEFLDADAMDIDLL